LLPDLHRPERADAYARDRPVDLADDDVRRPGFAGFPAQVIDCSRVGLYARPAGEARLEEADDLFVVGRRGKPNGAAFGRRIDRGL
jgi:hypothetical protein